MENNTEQKFIPTPYDPKEIIKNFEPKYEFIKEIKELLLLIDNKYWTEIKNEFEKQATSNYLLDILYNIVDKEASKIVAEKKDNLTFTEQIIRTLDAITRENPGIHTQFTENTTFKEIKTNTVSECLYQAYNYTPIFNNGIKNCLYNYINQNEAKFRHIPTEELKKWANETLNTASFDLCLEIEVKEFTKQYKKQKYTVIFENADFPTEFEAFNAEEAAEKAINQANELVKKINIKLYLPDGLKVYKTNEYEKKQNIKPIYVQNKAIAIG